MSLATEDMAELDDRDREVLRVLADGRANPYLIREETGLDKGDTNTTLVRLSRGGYVEQTTRGLYEITEKGADEVGAVFLDAEELRDAVQDARESYEDVDGNGVDDAIARLEELTEVNDG